MKAVKECPVCNSKKIRKDFDFPKTMCCCDDCGSDFVKNGEVTFDAIEKERENDKIKRGTQRSPFGIGS